MITFLRQLIALVLTTCAVSSGARCCNSGVKANRFVLITEFRANWHNAGHFCARVGMRLAHISSQEDQDLLVAAIISAGKGDQYWLGASDLGTEGQFVWYFNGVRMQYSRWTAGQPDNFGNKEHCLHLWPHGNWAWNDYPCDSESFFVCEPSS